MTATHDDHTAALPDMTVDTASVRNLALVALVAGAIGYGVFGAINLEGTSHGLRDFFQTYLTAFVFWASFPIGAVGLSCIGFLGSASFGIVLRRSWQASIRTLPFVAVMFVPVVVSVLMFGDSSPFWWANPVWVGDNVASISVITGVRPEGVIENQHKIHDYLNPWFFTARAVFYFGAWFAIGSYFLGQAKKAEGEDDATARERIKGAAGPALISWALLTTFAVTDWVMSVEPTWASSMFPVVFGMNAFISTMAFGALVFYTLTRGNAEVLAIVKDKFRIDLGSLLFGFTMVWAYATFCQYMLIWAGNLPEEISYYRKRADHGWQYMAYFLMAVHWLAPFVIFLFREVKTDPRRMRVMCSLLLVVCAADVIWWIVPCVPHEGWAHFPMAVSAILMVGGAWVFLYQRELAKYPILPGNAETKFMAGWGHH
ncbi:MAG: hypothetical protein ACRC7O_17730 [Fimbriiglobus sp.]